MNKVPYEVVALEVERLYSKKFPTTALAQIEEHCNFISQFIESCGWTVEDYFRRYMRDTLDIN